MSRRFARILSCSVVLSAVLSLAGSVAWAQDLLWRSGTFFGARRDVDGRLLAPVQQFLLAEAGGPREPLSLRLDLRVAMDAAQPADRGLEVYELLVRHGRPGESYEVVAGRQVLLSGTGAFLADAARVSLDLGQALELVAAAGLERHPEVATPVLGPHLAMISARSRRIPRTVAQLTYLERDDREGRREDRLGATAHHWLPVSWHPELDLATEAELNHGRLYLAEAGLTAHPARSFAFSVWGSRTEPQSWGPVLSDGIWQMFMSGPSYWVKAQAAWSGGEGSLAGSCARIWLQPRGEDPARGELCRLAYQAPSSWPVRPAGSLFALEGGMGQAAGGGLGLTATPGLDLDVSLRSDVVVYEHASGVAGTSLWARASLGRHLLERLQLEAVGELGLGGVLPEELRGLVVVSYRYRGVQP
ncbi:MAG: hypothetical protein RBU45_10630 [Myxococcota bacterium]|jgi:hypothetical protein|nr:hypothetical protein [Myxococcota bacterium]